MHGTVDHVVDRLAAIESEMRAARPATPVPVRPLAIEPAPEPEPTPAIVEMEPQSSHEPEPVHVTPRERAPIDPNLPPDFPLEPGVGTPSMRPSASAAERIAASEAALAGAKIVTSGSTTTNFIAAARRAAQAAAPAASANKIAETPRSEKGGGLGQRMKKLFVGAGVILILVGGYRLATRFSDVINVAADSAMRIAAPAPSAIEEPTAPATTEATPNPRSDIAAPNAIAAAPAAEPEITGAVPPPSAGTLVLPALPEAAAPSNKLPEMLRKAAANGDPAAAYEIAVRHIEGRGVPVSMDEAARWLQRAAKSGIAPAQFRLGSLYEKGQGVKKDLATAQSLYNAAAEKGNARAMHNLAVLYAEGAGGKPDYQTAGLWFRKAADFGVADSQYNLGILYARGVGIGQSLVESYKWFGLAAAQGDKDAAKKRDEIGARLDPAALKAAKHAIETFVPEPQPEQATAVKMPEGGWDRPATAAQPKRRTPAAAPMRIAPT
jgi:localization factor PodJL